MAQTSPDPSSRNENGMSLLTGLRAIFMSKSLYYIQNPIIFSDNDRRYLIVALTLASTLLQNLFLKTHSICKLNITGRHRMALLNAIQLTTRQWENYDDNPTLQNLAYVYNKHIHL